MYTATLQLNDINFTGTLDLFTLKESQKEYVKLTNDTITIADIFKKLSDMDMTLLSILLIKSITRINSIDENIIVNAFSNNEEDTIDKFKNCFTYINDLLEECMPKPKQEKESEFEDVPDFSVETKDWDFVFMEYLWTTTLKRIDFWSTTPKNFFEQLDLHTKINTTKTENTVEEI